MKAERSSGDSANRPPPRDWLRPAGRRPPPKERPFAPDWLDRTRLGEKLRRPDEYLELVFLMLFLNNKRLLFEQSVNYIPIIYICKGLRRKILFLLGLSLL